MYFPLVLTALVIISTIFLLRQYWRRDLADTATSGEDTTPELLTPHRDAASSERRDALKAA